MTELCFLLDPLESLNGPLKPPFLIAKKIKHSFSTVFASQFVDAKVSNVLETCGFDVLNSGKNFLSSGSLLSLEAWLRKSESEFEQVNRLIVNFSQCYLANAHIYYAQGPMTNALTDMYPEMKRTHKLVYRFLKRFIANRDKEFITKLRAKSKLFVANSKFCAKMYEDYGIQVDDIVYPPLDCEHFKPTTTNPSVDYALAYFGKETKYHVLKTVADAGVKLKAFGSKEPYIPSYIRRHPNIDFQGKVSDKELADLYSNALFTLFTFTHEPFGYIPVESMACGTPVLTYNMQGPRESVVNDQTGWLVGSDEELSNAAIKLWNGGFNAKMRKNCRNRALEFDSKLISKQWLELIELVEDEKVECRPRTIKPELFEASPLFMN